MRAPRVLRRGPRPPAPPFAAPERVRQLEATAPTDEFVTGNGFAAHCRRVLNYDVLRANASGDRDWWFCKADYLEHFFERHAPRRPYVLVSHNSDRAIDERFAPRLDDGRLVAWFAQNPAVDHPKLHAIPIGLANPVWPHGDQEAFRRLRADPPPKNALLDVAFDVSTCPEERQRCLAAAGVEPPPRVGFEAYLRRLAGSYFCLAPRGNGIDTHRTWEALYLGTIPVVTRSVLTEQHRDLPLVVLEDWEELRSLELTPELHRERWGSFDPATLRLDAYLDRLDGVLARTVP